MYISRKPDTTTLSVNDSYEGETIEEKVRRIMNNNEPITDSAPLIYTERKDGVMPAYDIRTDRFELAIDAMDAATKGHLAKREARQKLREEGEKAAKKGSENEGKTTENGGKPSSIQATD